MHGLIRPTVLMTTKLPSDFCSSALYLLSLVPPVQIISPWNIISPISILFIRLAHPATTQVSKSVRDTMWTSGLGIS